MIDPKDFPIDTPPEGNAGVTEYPPRPTYRAADGRFVRDPRVPVPGFRWKGRHGPHPAPWTALWRRRGLPPEFRHVARLVAARGGALLDDHPDPSAARVAIIEDAAVAYGCCQLLFDALRRAPEGPTSERGLKLLDALRGFMTVEMRALDALGLERRAKPVPSVAEFVEARAALNRGEGA